MFVGIFELFDLGGIGIAEVFGGGVEALLLVGGIKVGIRVSPFIVRPGFLMPVLARGSEAAGLMHEVVSYVVGPAQY